MSYGIIYKITNLINGKCYVGQTKGSLDYRWYHHCHKSSKCLGIHNAIIKYGKENFRIEEIDSATTKDELNFKEAYWINKLNTISPCGYNLKTGGNDCTYSKESRQKMSKSIKEHWKKEVFPTSKLIYQYKLDGSFVKSWTSATAAARELNLQQSDISRCCNKVDNYKSAGGYLWSYDKTNDLQYNRLGNGLKRKIICIETGEIFESVTAASKAINKSTSDISKCCHETHRTSGGYHWKYIEEKEVG